jgi:hypothetical protein
MFFSVKIYFTQVWQDGRETFVSVFTNEIYANEKCSKTLKTKLANYA